MQGFQHVKAIAPLATVPGIGMVRSFVSDPMHVSHGGVLKDLAIRMGKQGKQSLMSKDSSLEMNCTIQCKSNILHFISGILSTQTSNSRAQVRGSVEKAEGIHGIQ